MEPGYRPCPYCAEPIREGAVVCRYCNRSVVPSGSSRPPSPPSTAEAERAVSGKGKSKVSSGLLAVLVVVLGIALLVIHDNLSRTNGKHGHAASAAVQAALAPVPVNLKLISGNMEVDPGQIKWVNFTVPPNAANAKVTGEFHAFGGAGNDIQVVITDPFDFENWKNGHPTNVVYASSKVTNGVISVRNLSPGNYVVAFDNRFSIVSRKEVTGNITLSYLLQ